MRVKCPYCGKEFEVKRKMGSGTKVKAKKLSKNDMIIAKVLIDLWNEGKNGFTVRGLQKYLYSKGIKRISRKGLKGWNYHEVQSQLSRLVGMGILRMYVPKIKKNKETGEYKVNRTPKYYINVPMLKKVMENGGRLE